MGKKAQLGAGTVPLVLADETVELIPSLEACMAISKLAGNSLTQAVSRVMDRLDFEFVVEIVALGIGATSPALKKQVAEKIYRQGVISVAGDCVLYIRTVMNGGVRPDEDEIANAVALVERLGAVMPDDLRADHVPALERLRSALIAKVVEEDEGTTADPLPAS